jgi:Mg2+ and Co2+ transporter CorA
MPDSKRSDTEVGESRLTLVDAPGTVLSAAARDDIERRVPGKSFFWLDVHEPTSRDVAMLGDVFGFHALALEGSAEFGQCPKIEAYDSYAFLVVYGAASDEV